MGIISNSSFTEFVQNAGFTVTTGILGETRVCVLIHDGAVTQAHATKLVPAGYHIATPEELAELARNDGREKKIWNALVTAVMTEEKTLDHSGPYDLSPNRVRRPLCSTSWEELPSISPFGHEAVSQNSVLGMFGNIAQSNRGWAKKGPGPVVVYRDEDSAKGLCLDATKPKTFACKVIMVQDIVSIDHIEALAIRM